MKNIRSDSLAAIYNCGADELMSFNETIGTKATLVFLDPPFNQGEPYPSGDALPDDKYQLKLKIWLHRAAKLVAETGSLWVNLPDKWIAIAVQFLQESEDMTLENWCIWHYRFAQCQKNRFLRSKTHVVWFSKGNPLVNTDAALVPSDRAMIYDDPRAMGLRMDFDVWGFDQYWGRVQGNNKERGITPNQLPEAYLKRVIGVCTTPGDLVIDPFAGSGTTATVARAMGRKCLTCDLSLEYCQAAAKRIFDIGTIER